MPSPKPADKPSTSPPQSGQVAAHIEDGDRLRVLDHVEGGIAVCQSDAFLYANEPFLRMLGYPSVEALAKVKVSDVASAAYDAWVEKTAAGVPQTESWRCADGSELRVDVSASTMKVGEMNVRVVLVRDLSASWRAQSQLLQTERLATIGTLATGVAHQINNPLAYVIANINFLAEEIPPFLRSLAPTVTEEQAHQLSDLLGAMADAREGAERVARIVRDLRTLSRMEEDRHELIDVNSLVDSASLLVESELKNRAQLVKVYDAVVPVEGNPSRLAQVFLNLLLNAAQAIPEGNASGNEVTVRTFVDERDGFVTIDISDTGVGMSHAVQARIFDPFYTRKPIGQGTGLGLTTCLAIVHHMGGSITVESEEGRGARFRVKLPSGVRSAKRETTTMPPSDTGRPRVLVVDDELTLLSSLRRALAREVEVVLASSAKEASALLEHDDRFDLVLCDIMMPDVNGIELFESASKAHPALRDRFVFMTGGNFGGSVQQYLETTDVPILEKPFDLRELRRLLRSPAKKSAT
jgi:signal transduction histidine kinase/ActR/RegA family two-component response regulator